MDTGSQNSQVTSDDQELAKVLAGVNDQNDDNTSDDAPAAPAVDMPEPKEENPGMPTAPLTPPATPKPASQVASNDLSTVKKDAIADLRPLVDRLSLAPEEMFDTYLLLIRSTDDRTLVEPAYKAAQSIADENRKAQALLDIVKEIDYLNGLTK